MLTFVTHRSLRIAISVAVLACALSPVGPAAGAPVSTASTASVTATDAAVEAKKAEQAAALAELDRMRIDLGAQVSAYLELGKEIDRTRVEVLDVTSQLAQQEDSLAQLERAYESRVVQLYRTDRVGMLEILFTATSLQDLFSRAQYLTSVSSRDSLLVDDVRKARSESLWLQSHLEERVARMEQLQVDADNQRSRIESDLAAQQARATALGTDIASLLRKGSYSPGTGATPSGDFNPDYVIAEQNYRDADSMTAEQIQAFLEAQSGTLATYKAKDHNGVTKLTSQMIAEAAQAWGVSPKVILVSLQKEQSLLTRAHPSQKAYDWAMGCGRADSRTYYQYQGFGNQIWWGAQKLQKNADKWSSGTTLKIDGSVVRPTNPGTYGLYKYTPHFPGVMSFWMIYWRHFGDPLA